MKRRALRSTPAPADKTTGLPARRWQSRFIPAPEDKTGARSALASLRQALALDAPNGQPRNASAPSSILVPWLFVFLLALYLITGGGKGYSIDGAFGYEMAKTVFLDPSHAYFHRFKTAFARWGALLPVLGQPFVLAGDALSRLAPERDALRVDGHTYRVEEWPALSLYGRRAAPAPTPERSGPSVASIGLISFMANAAGVPHGATVGEVRLWGDGRQVTLPVRAGIETAEWAHDRPDVTRQMQHQRAPVAGKWIGQPRGNLYYARLALPQPMAIDRWELAAADGLGAAGEWHIRAAAFRLADGTWADAHTGERYWSERQTRDFFTRLAYSTLNAFTTAATAVLVYLVAGQFGYGRSIAAVVALGFGVGTLAWPYAKLDFSEPAATLFVMLAVWCLYRAFPPRQSSPPNLIAGAFRGGPSIIHRGGRHPPEEGQGESIAVSHPLPLGESRGEGIAGSPTLPGGEEAARPSSQGGTGGAGRLGLVASGALLAAVAGKYTLALAAAAVVTQWAITSRWWEPRRRAPALRFLAALVIPATVLGLAGIGAALAFTGEKPIVLTSGTSRLAEDWLALPFWTGFRGLVLSPGKSLFLYAPWLVLALPGAVLFLRRHGSDGLLFTVYPAAVVALYSMKLVFHGGSWGPRYLVPVIPLLCVATAPVIARLLAAPPIGRLALGALAAVAVAVQVAGVAKDPEQYPAMVREHVVPFLPEHGSAYGGRDYWLARGGDGLARALREPGSGARRGLGYAWGLPEVTVTLPVRAPQTFTLSLYFVDWDRQSRRQDVVLDDAMGRRAWRLDRDFGDGIWASWQVTATPEQPARVTLLQRGPDTAVVSAATFDPARGERRDQPALDERTQGDWIGVYGASGYVLFAFRSFNVDVAAPPAYLGPLEIIHIGDNPNPRIHVEIAEADVLDTPLLYALPFSPILGNLWLIAADVAKLSLPARPDVAAALLARPPWTWFGIDAPRLQHPEYGLGLDFWPTLVYTAYASHAGVLAAMWVTLLGLEAALLLAAYQLVCRLASRRDAVLLAGALALCLALYNWLQVQA